MNIHEGKGKLGNWNSLYNDTRTSQYNGVFLLISVAKLLKHCSCSAIFAQPNMLLSQFYGFTNEKMFNIFNIWPGNPTKFFLYSL